MTNDRTEKPKKAKRLVLTKETLRVYSGVRCGDNGTAGGGRPTTTTPLRVVEEEGST